MASSPTPIGRLELQNPGENNPRWGNALNGTLTRIEEMIDGELVLGVTGGTRVLSTANYSIDEARMARLYVSGALASNQIIQVPALTKRYVVTNRTTGSYSLTIKTALAAGVSIPQGYSATLISRVDGEVYMAGPPVTAGGAISDIANRLEYASSASDIIVGEAGAAFDFLSRTAVINDYADTLSTSGRPHSTGLLTTVRATTAMGVARSRLLASAAINTMRYDHVPLTGVPRGLRLDPTATNLLLRSQELSNASWVKSNATITADSIAAPDGTTTADTITWDTASSGTVSQAVTVPNDSNPNTVSAFVKMGTSAVVRLRGDYSVGTGINAYVTINAALGTLGTPVNGTAVIEDYGNGWWRVGLTVTNNASGNTTLTARLDQDAAALGQTVYGWGLQAESGAVMTAYIPTVGSTVTRNSDNISIATSLIPFDATQGMLFVEFARQALRASEPILVLHDGTANEAIEIAASASPATINFSVVDGGVTQATIPITTTYVAGETIRVAVAWRANDFIVALNGNIVGTDASGTLPTVTTLSFGRNAAGTTMAGWISRVAYWSRRPTENELKSLTMRAA